MKIGVLAIQGDFAAHGEVLASLGVDPVFVRYATQLDGIEGLIIPGGESTTMLKLLDEESLFEPLSAFAVKRPIMGTCAGTILLASDVTSPAQRSLALLDITVERTAYGRQLDSSIRQITPSQAFADRVGGHELEAVFIRAPIIRRIGENVEVLLEEDGDPVLVEQGRHLAVTFHPELSADLRVHQLFLAKVCAPVKVGA